MSGLTKHEKRHEPPGGFLCHLCNAPFVNYLERNHHRELVHKLYKCSNCGEKFTNEEDFISHIERVHDGKDRVYCICTDCGKEYRTPAQLK